MIIPTFTKTWHTTTYPAIDTSKPFLSTAGKNIVITGGGRGIGASIAYHFARSGSSTISLLGRDAASLLSVQAKILAEFPSVKVHHYPVDITDAARVEVVFKEISAKVGKIDVLVNNAAGTTDKYLVKDFPLEEFWKVFEVNIKGSVIVAQAFLKHNATDSVLVNVSTAMVHLEGYPADSGYKASKAGAVIFFDCLQEQNPDIRIVNLHPGQIDTEMSRKANGPPSPDDASLPAATAVWLTSPEAAFLKGKFIWTNWDVEEMKARAEEIQKSNLLTLNLIGWPFENFTEI